MGGRSGHGLPNVSQKPAATFSAHQLDVLHRLLGDRFNQVVPGLARAVRWCKSGHKVNIFHAQARLHLDATARLEQECQRVLQSLREIDPLVPEAVSWRAIDGQNLTAASWDYSEDIPPQPDAVPANQQSVSLSELSRPSWARGQEARAALENLVSDIQAWKSVAGILAPRPRGRQIGEQGRLNLWAGTVLKRAGFRLTTARHGGKLTVVLKIVGDAAGLPVPKDRYRQLQDVCDRLQLKEFIETCCLVDTNEHLALADLFSVYTTWADREGLPSRDRMSKTRFGRRLGEQFRADRDASRNVIYVGIARRKAN